MDLMNHSNIGAFLGRLTQTSLACTWTPTYFSKNPVQNAGAPNILPLRLLLIRLDVPIGSYRGPKVNFAGWPLQYLEVLSWSNQCLQQLECLSSALHFRIYSQESEDWAKHTTLLVLAQLSQKENMCKTCAKHVYIWLVKAWKTNPLIRYINFPLPIWAG